MFQFKFCLSAVNVEIYSCFDFIAYPHKRMQFITRGNVQMFKYQVIILLSLYRLYKEC
jgi:hypothetical protein